MITLPPEVLGNVGSHLTKKQRLSVFCTDTCAYAEVEVENVLTQLQPVTAQIRNVLTVLNQQLKDRNQFNPYDQGAKTPNVLFSEWPRHWQDDALVPQMSINQDVVDALRDGGIVCSWIKETDLSNEIRFELHTSQACTFTMHIMESHAVEEYEEYLNTERRWLEFRMTYTDRTACVVRIDMCEEDVYRHEYGLSIFLGNRLYNTGRSDHADAVRLWKSRTRDVASFVTAILRAQQEPYLCLHLSGQTSVPFIQDMSLEMCGQYGLVQRAL